MDSRSLPPTGTVRWGRPGVGALRCAGLRGLPGSDTVGEDVNLFSATGGSGTNYGVYEVTTGGTFASTHPAGFVCNSGTSGNTVTDPNGVVDTFQRPKQRAR